MATTAALDADGTLRILVVNNDPEKPATATVVPADYRHAGTVEVATVSGVHGYQDINTIEHPDDIRITRHTCQAGSAAFAQTFAPASVTVLTLPPA